MWVSHYDFRQDLTGSASSEGVLAAIMNVQSIKISSNLFISAFRKTYCLYSYFILLLFF